MNILYSFPLHCDFCSGVTGSVEVSSLHGWTQDTATEAAYRAKHKIVDIRCSPCETIHGSFKDLTAEYIAATQVDDGTAEAFVRVNKSRDTFTPALAVVLKETAKKKDINNEKNTP